jgi:cytoskeleton protein RodZ
MTERDAEPAPGIGVESLAPTAGALLRAAREKRGVHIAALAASMKVPQRKLEALEADRYDELPDMTFTRALAQSVCRALKVDMQPVLDRLPQGISMTPKLAQVGTGLNAPFRDRPGREEPTDWSWLRRPVVWGPLLVLAAALLLAFAPQHWLDRFTRGRAPTAAAVTAAPVQAEVVPAVVVAPMAPAASSTVEPAAAASAPETTAVPAASGPGGSLSLKVSAESWVEVQDANGQLLLSRKLASGETATLDGALPLRLTIGNAAATQVTFRGKPVDLSLNTRDNVARIQIN